MHTGRHGIPGAKGSMNVTSSPLNVKVYLDSRYIGEAPAVFPEIASGIHTVEFRKDGFASLSKNVTIIEGKTTNIMVVLEYIPPATVDRDLIIPRFCPAVVIIALIAIAGGGYYFWNKKMKSKDEKEEEAENESE